MSAISDIILIGAVGVVGYYLYNSSKPVHDAVDDTVATAEITLLADKVSSTDFKNVYKKVKKDIEDNSGATVPEVPDPLLEVVQKDLSSPLPLPVTVITEYTTNQIVEETKKDPQTIIKDLQPKGGANLIAEGVNALTDIVTGKYEWTGFKIPW